MYPLIMRYRPLVNKSLVSLDLGRLSIVSEGIVATGYR